MVQCLGCRESNAKVSLQLIPTAVCVVAKFNLLQTRTCYSWSVQFSPVQNTQLTLNFQQNAATSVKQVSSCPAVAPVTAKLCLDWK